MTVRSSCVVLTLDFSGITGRTSLDGVSSSVLTPGTGSAPEFRSPVFTPFPLAGSAALALLVVITVLSSLVLTPPPGVVITVLSSEVLTGTAGATTLSSSVRTPSGNLSLSASSSFVSTPFFCVPDIILRIVLRLLAADTVPKMLPHPGHMLTPLGTRRWQSSHFFDVREEIGPPSFDGVPTIQVDED